jgi:cobalt-zinc-cadmium efflux system membrane fusion protein
MRNIVFVFFLIGIVFLNSCTSHKEESTKENVVEEVHASNEVSLTKEQYEGIKIQVGKIERKNLSSLVKASGVLDLPPQNKASVSSLVGGVITKIHVIQGDLVKQGQTLATLEHPDILRLQQDYIEAKNSY